LQPIKFTAFPACAIIAICVVLTGGILGAQEPTIAQVPVGPPVIRTPEATREDAKIREEQLKRLNTARQAAIKKDTDKLLQLATELKQSVDRSNEHTLSLDVVKKAEQIEKLAHSVKEKMKSGY